MSHLVALLLVCFVALFVAGLLSARDRSSDSRESMNYILAFVLVCFAAYCAFGFLASFEPGDFMAWRTVYGVLFVGAVLGALRLLLRRPATD